jgi:hypothetical protein
LLRYSLICSLSKTDVTVVCSYYSAAIGIKRHSRHDKTFLRTWPACACLLLSVSVTCDVSMHAQILRTFCRYTDGPFPVGIVANVNIPSPVDVGFSYPPPPPPPATPNHKFGTVFGKRHSRLLLTSNYTRRRCSDVSDLHSRNNRFETAALTTILTSTFHGLLQSL